MAFVYKPSAFMLPDSHYDKAKADRAVAFIENLCHTKGKWAGKPFLLLPWQEQIVRDLFGIVKEDGKRQFLTAYIEIPKKNGKQLALDTPIPTPDGWKTMGTLAVGDCVFDERGKPSHVVAKSLVDDTEQAYELVFRDGGRIVAGERHLWDVEYIHGKTRAKRWTTGEIYRRTRQYCETFSDNRSIIRIPVNEPLHLPEANLPVDPYLYGYWLGNGCATKPEITVRDCDVDDLISFIPYPLHNRYPQTCGGSEILVYKELKNILVPHFREKVIRPEYLRSSEHQRWELLQGLMDSDGCVSDVKGQSIYVSTIRQLAESVQELLWTLGIKNSLTTCPSTRYGEPTGEILYQIRFTAFTDQPVSKLHRKSIRRQERVKQTRSCFHYLKEIRMLDYKVKMQCIQVDSPSHCYLAGRNMVKTHNSELAATIALYLLYADNEPSAEVYGAACDRNQASIVFDVARQMVEMSPALMRRSKIRTAGKRIINYRNAGFYQVLSAETGCLAPDTILQKKDGSLVRADEIQAGDEILSADGLTPYFDKVKSVKVQDAAPVLKIRSAKNREIIVTEQHPFYRMLVGRRRQDLTHVYDWEKANSLIPKDRIALALGWPADYQGDSTLSTEEAWAMGAWAGDGDCSRFRFINPDRPVIQKMRRFIESIGSTLRSDYSTRQKQEGKNRYQDPIEHMILGNGKRRKSPGREWVRKYYGQKARAKNKHIPEAVLKGSPEIWAAFLAGLIDTDGCVNNPKKKTKVSICSVSERMRKECQILFARLGINASTQSGVLVTVSTYAQIRKLWAWISRYMVHPGKRKRLQEMVDKEILHHVRTCESEIIAEISELAPQQTISIEMETYQTHVTNGFITHNTKHGLNVSGLIFDEIHAQPNRKLYDVLTKGSGDAREQPLFFIITTAGNDKNSICYELHTKALDIMHGKKKDYTFYPKVYGLEEGEDWTDEANWYKANPSLGYTINIERVREAYRNAIENPAEENVFKQLRLNIWTSASIRWIPEQVYDKGNLPINLESLRGRMCYGGLDLSSTSDITALVLAFPPRSDDEKYVLLPFFWLPEDTLELRCRRDHVLYDVWQKQGFIQTTEGNVIHYGFIEKFIEHLGETYNIREIAYDRWNATQMVQNLEDMGFTMVPFGQGFKDMSPPSKELFKLLMEGNIVHGGNPVLKWMAGNVVMRQDPAGNIKPDKEKSVEKIDGIVASIMALDRCIRNGTGSGSVYDERGVIAF